MRGALKGEEASLISDSMTGRSDRRSRVNCDANCELVVSTSSLAGSEVAVVSQRPGIWCDRGPGRTEMEVGMGIWKDKEED